MTLTDKIATLRAGLDEMDRINALKSKQQKANDYLEADILKDMAEQGMDKDGDKVSACGLTVTRAEKQRATYSPDKWMEIGQWAFEQGIPLIQRRLNDKVVRDLIESGVALPEGLGVEFYTELSTRRTG